MLLEWAQKLFRCRLGVDVDIWVELELGRHNPTKLFHFSRLGVLEFRRGKKKPGCKGREKMASSTNEPRTERRLSEMRSTEPALCEGIPA